MNEQAQSEHRWLARLIGEWEYESEYSMGPDQPPGKMTGSDSVGAFGDLWVIANGQAQGSDGPWKSIMTLGYNPASQRFVGTFVADMMSYLWVYSGTLDTATDTLTLDADGPDFTTGKIIRYQDIIQLQGPDSRTLTSRMQGEDGQWRQIMQATYRRKA
ncbi:DUF1579 domain-containing protein [Chitinimonas koreensis]|uniref:DUF1579 domain-containing protein n=1 Tax=Chitinimonas koreensis TaxID=356302 RepID=UPI0004051543|nr:DUF1579 domain-containing protein [Chitinimonas koreensis]QNM98635.1 DUF1579 domain-containing protein [Chitinimonas koreensis]